MTIDEAIKHCEEVAEDKEKTIKIYKAAKATEEAIAKCEKCAEEHKQLAEWLKELKELRGKYARLRRECNEVIDEICRLREG